MRRAIIVGFAECVATDLSQAAISGFLTPDVDLICVNEAYRVIQRMDVWATLHPEKLRAWTEDAKFIGRDLRKTIYVVPDLDQQDRVTVMKGQEYEASWLTTSWDWGGGNSGSSGLFAVGVAFSLGYERLILAGVPMDIRGHWNNAQPWTDRDRFVTAWCAAKHMLEGRVRSLSGWSREFLGGPDLQWWCH